ncbi:MAG: flagellar protein FlgN [Firmicutes bacterium]|nr:flagellar protein FlgN [Bacillota bacterium]
MQQQLPGQAAGKITNDSPLADLIDGLMEILSQATATVEALTKEAEHKQDALLRDDLTLLEEVVAREVGLLQELEQWEAQRVSQVACIEGQLQSSGILCEAGTSISLDEIARKLSDARGQRLLRQGEELRGSMLRLQELNLLNADLLRHSLTLANYCLSLITGDTGQTIYGEPGKKERQGYQPGRLDARA